MPNWVRNHVKFGTNKVIKDCIINKHGETQFDFNKIIPMPKELEEEGGLEKLTLEQRLVFLKENDGCDNWYNWSVEHWGTKWNSSETEVLDAYEVEFDTAWSMPEPVFKEISKKYHTTVEVDYADEGITENSGHVLYSDGEEVEYQQGDENFCEKMWGWDDED